MWSRRTLVSAVACLAVLGGVAGAGPTLAAGPTGGPGPAPGGPGPHPQQAVCGSVAAGYARCFAHVVDLSSGSSSGSPSARPPGPGVTNPSPTGLPPVAITTAYNFPVTSTSPYPGAGQTVAIVDAYDDSTIANDLSVFDNQYGLPACTTSNLCFTKVNQSGGTSYPSTNSNWALEISLDVEWAHAVAPGAKILLVEASSNSFTNLLTAVSYASQHARYVSMSWGGSEFTGETSYDSHFTTAGVSYFVAAGDSGTGAEYPSASSNVISVGGTTLTLNQSTWQVQSETGWSSGGGGCSAYEKATPAQAAFPTYDQSGANCSAARATPDVALDADPNTGASVYDSTTYNSQSGWWTVGGTSASTPMWAARSAVAGATVNSSYVYGSTIPFYDITSGNNGMPCEAGYDLCTGLGSWSNANGTVNGSGGGGVSAPSAPTGVSATAGSGQVTVSWTASSGATSYSVYDGTAQSGENYTAAGCTTGSTSCTVGGLNNGTTYYFTVKASNTAGSSPPSGEVSAKPTPGTTSTVSVSSIKYSTSGPHGSNLNVTLALNPPLSGATVAINLDLNGSLYGSGSGSTGSTGTITFTAKSAPRGTYTTTVTGVTANGYTWDGVTPSNSYTKT